MTTDQARKALAAAVADGKKLLKQWRDNDYEGAIESPAWSAARAAVSNAQTALAQVEQAERLMASTALDKLVFSAGLSNEELAAVKSRLGAN